MGLEGHVKIVHYFKDLGHSDEMKGSMGLVKNVLKCFGDRIEENKASNTVLKCSEKAGSEKLITQSRWIMRALGKNNNSTTQYQNSLPTQQKTKNKRTGKPSNNKSNNKEYVKERKQTELPEVVTVKEKKIHSWKKITIKNLCHAFIFCYRTQKGNLKRILKDSKPNCEDAEKLSKRHENQSIGWSSSSERIQHSMSGFLFSFPETEDSVRYRRFLEFWKLQYDVWKDQ